MRVTYKVPYAEIKQAIRDGATSYQIMKRWKVPESVCKNIRKGKKITTFTSNSRKEEPKEGFCSCCGFREIMEGNKFLCSMCYTGKSGVTDTERHGMPSFQHRNP